MRHHRGFTLIEIVVALVIAAVAAAVVAPSFSSAIRTAEIKAAARNIAAILNTVRSRAVGKASETSLVIDVGKRVITFGDSEKTYELPNKVEMKVTAADSERIAPDIIGIRFFPDGSSTGGRIELSYADKEFFAIDVDWLTGSTRILD